MLFALAGSLIGAVVHVIDTYLYKRDIFFEPVEPAIISAVMQAMAWTAIPFIDFSLPADPTILFLGLFAGLLHTISLVLYFRVLFSFGDISLISILWNLLLGMVPLLAFVFLGEHLAIQSYFGIALLFAGANMISYSEKIEKKVFRRVVVLMIAAVFFMSASVVCMKYVFENTSYWSGYFSYNFGIVLSGLLGYIFFLKRRYDKRFLGAIGKLFWFFVGIEFLQLVGEFFSNLAVDFGPVSLVTALESLQSAFVILLCLLILAYLKLSKKEQGSLLAKDIRTHQLNGFGVKWAAIVVMVFGAYLIG